MPEKCQAFLRAYIEAEGEWTLVGAAAALGIHRNSHEYWKKKVPGYAEAYEKAKVEVKYMWRHYFAKKAKNGLEERMYNADGTLKYRRNREDAGLLKAHLMAIDPELYNPDRGKNSNVVINIVQQQEWTEPGGDPPEDVVDEDE